MRFTLDLPHAARALKCGWTRELTAELDAGFGKLIDEEFRSAPRAAPPREVARCDRNPSDLYHDLP
jgi:hypothetical protein